MAPSARVHPHFEALEVVLEPDGHMLRAYLPATVLERCFSAPDDSDWLAVYARHKARIDKAVLARASHLSSLSAVMVMTEQDFSSIDNSIGGPIDALRRRAPHSGHYSEETGK